MEGVILTKIDLSSTRVEQYDESINLDRRRTDLDLLDEIWREAQLKIASYQQRIARYYHSWVKPKIFRVGDLVFRRAEVSKPIEQKKIISKLRGPLQNFSNIVIRSIQN